MPFTLSGEGPFSAVWRGKETWVFGYHFLATPEGRYGYRSSGWYWNEAGQGGEKLGPFQQNKDSRGQPLSLLPFTADEERFNRARSDPRCLENCGERWSVQPGPVISLPHDEGALLFYVKSFVRPGGLENISAIGSSIALWKDPSAQAVRQDLRPGTSEPTLLFQHPEPQIGVQAFAWGDYLYAYGSRIVARVLLSQALQRSSWTFYAGGGRWSKAWQEAVPVMNGYYGTVEWNWYLGKFVHFWNGFLADTLSISTADRPEGPWSQAQEIPLGPELNRKDLRIRHVIAHPELSQERGRVQYVTYQDATGMFRSETRLVELVFR